jgi:hypothetical protein
MTLKSKSKDKGKDQKTKSDSQKSQNTTKLHESTIFSTKPIKSLYEAIIKDEEAEHFS